MATWNSRGLRGSTLEELINFTIEKYEESNIALIQKIPTPIKPININHDTRQITLAYFDKKSTVDYIGVVQGIPVCFDAKECDGDTFSLQNVHRHQIDFMENLKGRKEFPLFCSIFRYGMRHIICHTVILDIFMTVRQTAAGKVSAMMRSIKII